MHKSKLLELLATFSGRDWSAFSDFVRSPYFNRNPELVRLSDWLCTRAPGGFSGVARSQVWAEVYPGVPEDQRQLNHLMSWLLKLAEQFLGQERLRSGRYELARQSAEALSARGLHKHFHFLAGRLRRELDAAPLRDAGYLLHRYRLADLEREHFNRQEARQFDEHLQAGADQLDYFYLTEKLKYACGMLNNQAIVSAAYAFHFVEEVRQFVEKHPFPPEAPGVAIYFRIYQMLTKEDGDADFQALKNLLALHGGKFSREEMAWLYGYALNFCIRQIRALRETYIDEALTLYERGIESGILLTEAGHLSPWHFKNIVKLALRLQRFNWTEQFIRDKHGLLAPEFRADALHYNLADLYFYTGQYDRTLEHLNRVEFSDIYYHLGAREMLAKVYYETGAFDALDSLLHAFKTYLQRNRVLADQVRKSYLNFIRLLRRLLRATPDQLPALRRRVEQTDMLTAKNWLLEQMI